MLRSLSEGVIPKRRLPAGSASTLTAGLFVAVASFSLSSQPRFPSGSRGRFALHVMSKTPPTTVVSGDAGTLIAIELRRRHGCSNGRNRWDARGKYGQDVLRKTPFTRILSCSSRCR
jgi:hypothetical protein